MLIKRLVRHLWCIWFGGGQLKKRSGMTIAFSHSYEISFVFFSTDTIGQLEFHLISFFFFFFFSFMRFARKRWYTYTMDRGRSKAFRILFMGEPAVYTSDALPFLLPLFSFVLFTYWTRMDIESCVVFWTSVRIDLWFDPKLVGGWVLVSRYPTSKQMWIVHRTAIWSIHKYIQFIFKFWELPCILVMSEYVLVSEFPFRPVY